MLLAIDPGPEQSAYCSYNPYDRRIHDFQILDNSELLKLVRKINNLNSPIDEIIIEKIASYGMPVGEEVFSTCIFIGRLIEASIVPVALITRQEIKLHLCKSPKANDATIKQALKDRFGDKGTKKKPGQLYGIKDDMWSALAVAVAYSEIEEEKGRGIEHKRNDLRKAAV
jgi:hypothetical protein